MELTAQEVASFIFIIVFGFAMLWKLFHMNKEKRFYNEKD